MAEYKAIQKEFKATNKEIFKENHRINKMIKEANADLSAAMIEHNCDKIVLYDTEFEMKKRVRHKHDMEYLENNFGDGSKLKEYKKSIELNKFDVVTRRHKKRQK